MASFMKRRRAVKRSKAGRSQREGKKTQRGWVELHNLDSLDWAD